MQEKNRIVRLLGMLNKRNLHRTINYIRKNGIKGLGRKIRHSALDPLHYNEWFERHRFKGEEHEVQSKLARELPFQPLISIVVPAYHTQPAQLEQMIDSVAAQTYPNWELVIANASPEDVGMKELFDSCKVDARVRVINLDKNGGISANTNAAIAEVRGEYVALLDHDDFLEPDALFEIVQMLSDGKADIVYTDEDKYESSRGEYMDPNFKPDFDMDLLRSYNYITHLFVVRTSLLREAGGLRNDFDGAQDYDLILRCVECAKEIRHVAKVLYHWRICQGSTADRPESKLYCYENGLRAIEEHLQRMDIPATVAHTDRLGTYHVRYTVADAPLLSVVIANKDHTQDLERCIASFASSYENLEIVVVENNSEEPDTFSFYERLQKEDPRVKVLTWGGDFNFSAINNFGVNEATGEYILLLNNDVQMITKDALREMLGILSRSDVGAVGARLLYADDTVQHGGIALGFGGYAGHLFLHLPRAEYGYRNRSKINCEYSAVTAACLMTKRSVYEQVGGLDELFAVAANDVDYCLKVRKAGYHIVYNGFSEWYHFESKTRGLEDTPKKQARFEREVALFRERWQDVLDAGDPYYNKNFPLNLASFTLD